MADPIKPAKPATKSMLELMDQFPNLRGFLQPAHDQLTPDLLRSTEAPATAPPQNPVNPGVLQPKERRRMKLHAIYGTAIALALAAGFFLGRIQTVRTYDDCILQTVGAHHMTNDAAYLAKSAYANKFR